MITNALEHPIRRGQGLPALRSWVMSSVTGIILGLMGVGGLFDAVISARLVRTFGSARGMLICRIPLTFAPLFPLAIRGIGLTYSIAREPSEPDWSPPSSLGKVRAGHVHPRAHAPGSTGQTGPTLPSPRA